MSLTVTLKTYEKYVRSSWPYGINKKREFEYIRKYYDSFSEGSYGEIDDQSWSDFSMDEVYTIMDRTYSSAGESILYNMLRTPLSNKEELKKRSDLIEILKSEEENRVKLQSNFFDLGKDRAGQSVDFMVNDLERNKFKRNLYIVLGRIIPIILLIGGFFNHYIFILLVIDLVINGFISSFERSKLVENKPMQAIAYIGRMLKVGKNVLKIDTKIINDYRADIEKSLNILNKDKRSFNAVSRNEGLEGLSLTALLKEAFGEAIGQITFDSEMGYYSVAENYEKYREPVKVLYESLGTVDALMAVAAYLHSIDCKVTKPNFINERKFLINKGVHPLVKNAIPNSIEIGNKGIVITGTNMSGKSTFLRMLGINIIFAQCFNFTLSEHYEAPFFNLVSSISPEDDVTEGKSYYLAEAEAILRIIKALEGELPVFCLIDEIFRGTNPVERIAASEEILKYIQKGNALSLVATHDRELTDLSKESHNFYHFSENINESTGLSFDYKLKEGVLKSGNAIKLLKYVGYPEEITKKAEAIVKKNIWK